MPPGNLGVAGTNGFIVVFFSLDSKDSFRGRCTTARRTEGFTESDGQRKCPKTKQVECGNTKDEMIRLSVVTRLVEFIWTIGR